MAPPPAIPVDGSGRGHEAGVDMWGQTGTDGGLHILAVDMSTTGRGDGTSRRPPALAGTQNPEIGRHVDHGAR
jgi:hypothetical protein